MTDILSSVTPEQRETLVRHISTTPVKLGALAEELGLLVKVGTLRPGVSGEIKRSSDSSSGFVIRISRHEKRERQRFTLAHEISHYLLHRDLIGDGISDDVLYRSTLSNSIEAEANRGAADILMPRKKVIERWKLLSEVDDEEAVAILAEEFGVSLQAMQIRLGV